MTDKEREVYINYLYKLLNKAETRDRRQWFMTEIAKQVSQRSPAQVARMEREAGLR